MKANELMIGDLVFVHKPTCKGHRVDYINEMDEEIGADGEIYNVCDVEPIPLTPEILEKNGFKFDGSGQRSMMFLSEPRFSEGKRFNIYVGLNHKTIDVFVAHPIEKSPNWRKSNKAYLEVCGPYVHELQHCLKLVGIDKEIIL